MNQGHQELKNEPGKEEPAVLEVHAPDHKHVDQDADQEGEDEQCHGILVVRMAASWLHPDDLKNAVRFFLRELHHRAEINLVFTISVQHNEIWYYSICGISVLIYVIQGFSLNSVRFVAKSRMCSLEFLGFIDILIKFIIFLVIWYSLFSK